MLNKFKSMFLVIILALIATVTGVYATWMFSEGNAFGASDDMNVMMGEISFAPPETVYITHADLLRTNNANNVGVSFTHPTYLTTTVNCSRANGSVTYKVTVYNNTDVTYWFLGAEWNQAERENAYLNVTNGVTLTTKDHVDDTSATFNTDDWVPPFTERELYVTYAFGPNVVGRDVSTLISLQFGVKMDSVQDHFLALLNNESSYEKLTEAFDAQYQETQSKVIANVGEDKKLFDDLLGENLTVNVDGVDMPVTILIRRDNVDKRTTGDAYDGNNAPSGCEYTLYITVDPLDSPTGEALVYAISYSRGGVGGADGAWYQLGQLYEGTATKVEYDDTGAYVIDYTKWEATANEYEFVDGKTYKVGYEQGDQYDKYKTLEQLMSAEDQDIYNDIDNSGILLRVYKIIHNSSNQNKAGYAGLKAAFEAAAPFYNVYNNGQEVKIKRTATRSELLPYMIAIQHELTYYNQING